MRQVQNIAGVSSPLLDRRLKCGAALPRLGGDHREVDIAVGLRLTACDRTEQHHRVSVWFRVSDDVGKHVERFGQSA